MSCFVRTHQLEHARSFVGAIVSPCVHTVALANLTHFWAQVAREREGEKKLSFAALSGKGKGEALKIKFFLKKKSAHHAVRKRGRKTQKIQDTNAER